MKLIFSFSLLALLAGCATPMISYQPSDNQAVAYNQGVGAITWETSEMVATIYPTFRLQAVSDIPTFTLMVQNKTDHNIDFMPENVLAYLDGQACHLYSYEERVGQIRSSARKRKVALAIAGGLAAGAAAYSASHQTVNYSSYGQIGYRQFWTSGSMQIYDPAAGMLAGAAVGAATGVGIHQIAREAGYEEQAAQAIFQHTTIRPGTTIAGQLMLRLRRNQEKFSAVELDVPIGGEPSTFKFTKKITSG